MKQRVWKVSESVLNLVLGQIASGLEKKVFGYLNDYLDSKYCNQAKTLKCYGRFDLAIALECHDFSFIDEELPILFLKHSELSALENVFIRGFRWVSDGIKFDYNKIIKSKFIGFYFITLDKDKIRNNPFEEEQRIIDKFYEELRKMNLNGALYESLGLIDIIIILGCNSYEEFFKFLSSLEKIATTENSILDISTLFGIDYLKGNKKIDTQPIEITLSTHYKPFLKKEIGENIQAHFGKFGEHITYLSSSGDLIIDLKAPLAEFTEKLLDYREGTGEGVLSTRTQFYKEEKFDYVLHDKKFSLTPNRQLSSEINKACKDLQDDKNLQHFVPILMEILVYAIAYENIQNDPLRKNVFLQFEYSFKSIPTLLFNYSLRIKNRKDRTNIEELKYILGQYSHRLRNILIQRLSEYQMITFSGMRIIGIEKFSGSLKILQAAESIPNFILEKNKDNIKCDIICGLGFQAEYSFTVGSNFITIPSQMYLEASNFWPLGHETGHFVWTDYIIGDILFPGDYEIENMNETLSKIDPRIKGEDVLEQTFADMFDYKWMFGGKDYNTYLKTTWEFMLKYGYDPSPERIVRSTLLLKLMVPEFRDKNYKEIVKKLIEIIRDCGKNVNIEMNLNMNEITRKAEKIADCMYPFLLKNVLHIIEKGNGVSIKSLNIDKINSELKNGMINTENNPIEIENVLIRTKDNKIELRKELTAIMSLYYYRLRHSLAF